jgi:hypothetical protein
VFPYSLLSLFLQHLTWDNVDVSTLWVEVTRAREAAATAKATHGAVVLAMETSAQEVATTRDSIPAWDKDAEDQSTLTERGDWERVSTVEAKSTTMLASAHKENESLVQKIALLEGELAKVRQARKVAEETVRGLSDVAADAERRQEEFERGHLEQLEEPTLL